MLRFVLSLLMFAGCFVGRVHADVELTVSAAASLKDALQEIKTACAAVHPKVRVIYNFGGSGLLQQQIEQGAPVDVFVSAAPRHMDALEKKGLLRAGSRRDLLGNELVLIAPKASTGVTTFADLAKPEVRHVMIGDPKSVPVGAYASEVFAHFKLTAALESKLVRALDVRQVLASVETRNAEAGVVYRTDAMISEKVRVVATAPAGSHAPIIYPVAVIKDSKHAAAADAFCAFLAGETARAVFTKHGFAPIP